MSIDGMQKEDLIKPLEQILKTTKWKLTQVTFECEQHRAYRENVRAREAAVAEADEEEKRLEKEDHVEHERELKEMEAQQVALLHPPSSLLHPPSSLLPPPSSLLHHPSSLLPLFYPK